MNPILNPVHWYHRRRRILPRLGEETARVMGACHLPITSSDRRLWNWRGKHRGQRAFIIGNGPSLSPADLDRLKNEVTFASNKIFLAFRETDWRPTYYSVSDVLVAENNGQTIDRLQLTKVFGSSVRPVLQRHGSNRRAGARTDCDRPITWLRELPTRRPRFSTNCAAGVHGGFSVVYHQLQLAFHLGIREVYLLGMDFSFSIPTARAGQSVHGAVLESTGERNHFHPEYRQPGERWTMPRLDRQYEAFTRAKQAFLAAGGEIVNVSRETKLDVFPRADFGHVLRPPCPATFPPAGKRATPPVQGRAA